MSAVTPDAARFPPFLRCKVAAATAQLAVVSQPHTASNVSVDNSSLRLKGSDGRPAGHSNGCLPSCNGNQWRRTLGGNDMTQMGPSHPMCSSASVKRSPSPQFTVCGRRTETDPSVLTITSTCVRQDVVESWDIQVSGCLRFKALTLCRRSDCSYFFIFKAAIIDIFHISKQTRRPRLFSDTSRTQFFRTFSGVGLSHATNSAGDWSESGAYSSTAGTSLQTFCLIWVEREGGRTRRR